MLKSAFRLFVFVVLFGFSVSAFAAAPTATTYSASNITTSSAMLSGAGNPNGQPTTGWFRYATTSPGTCNNSFGTRVPSTGGTDLGTGTSTVPYSITTTGLSPGNIYYFCAIVSNAAGTAFGTVQSFTIPAAPTVVTSGSSGVTSTGATLQGAANPFYSSTSGWFRYGTTNPGTCSSSFGTSSSSTSLGSGATSTPYSVSVSGLIPATMYYYCAVASNGVGTSYGSVLSFTTTAAPPTVSTSSATSVIGKTAVLNGSGVPGGASTTAWFRYSTSSPGTCNDTFGTRAPSSGGSSLGAGTTSVAFSQNISGLSPATTYYFCAIASSSAGTAFGSIYSMVTPSPPTVATTAASSLTSSSATLNGYADPNLGATTGWFRYSASNPGTCNDSFGSRAPTSGGSSLGSGSSNVSFAQSISGLTSGTTYYFCAIASNSEGTAFGSILSFVTAGGPSVTTVAATSITSSSATLNGAANPNGGYTYGWFRYSTTSPGTCNDSFGTRAPSSNISIGSGSTVIPFSASAYGLTPATTYYFCAIGNNSYGTSYGSVMSLTTPAAVPVVSTVTPTTITGTGAVLAGSANPGGATATGWFRYSTASPGSCNDSFGTRAPSSGGSSLGSGATPVAFTQSISGLSPNTTYYFCAIASNSAGTAFGSVLSFITPSPPTVMTQPASSISGSSASLPGSANPNRAATTGWFRYSTTSPGTCNDSFGSRAPTTGGTSLGNGTSSVGFYQSISSLSPATTYYFCAIASSSEGTAFGAVLTFTTASGPSITTVAATAITASGATLNGAGNPNGASTSGWFRYSTTSPGTCNDSFGSRAPSSNISIGAGTTVTPFSTSAYGLSPATTYYYCAIGNNSYGTSYGTVMSFTTPAAMPVVTTSSPTTITGTGAVLAGSANPGGASATGWFRYGTASPGTCNDTFGTRAPSSGGSSLGSGATPVAFTQNISGLTANTTYYFCAIASSSAGTAFGSVLSFITPSPPTVTTQAASSVSGSSATLNGSANPNRAATTGWFRYSTSSPGTCNDTFGSRAPTTGGSSLGNSTSNVSYYQSLSGLSPATTYYFCAIASSSEGTAFGAVLTFTTATGPKVTTLAATSVVASSATLNGSANPNGAGTTGWFRYGTSNPGTCSSSFGNSTSSVSLGAGTSNVPYSYSIGGLTPNTTYYFCAVANNSYGTDYGAIFSLTTTAAIPSVSTYSATSIKGTSAVLNGAANPGGASATGWFRYSTTSPGSGSCNDTFGTRAPSSGGTSLGSGTSSAAFMQSITGLSQNTTYYYCAIASNSAGTGYGQVYSLTTPSAPTVTTATASSLASSSATLNGIANPNRAATTGWFRYGTTNPGTCNDTFGTRAPSSSGTSLGDGTSSVSYSQSISGLAATTTYYYCAIASSAEGTSFGAVVSFITPAPPKVTTSSATSVTANTAILGGSANPNASSTTGWFRYSTSNPGTCSNGFGFQSGSSSLGSGTADVAFSQSVAGLAPGATYYYCAVAVNGSGYGYGALLSFTTASATPYVTTDTTSSVTTVAATLSGRSTPNGASTSGWFRYSTTNPGTCNDTFGTRAPSSGGTSLGAGTADVAYSQSLTGLTPGTTYYYCAVASNAVGTGFGSVRSFTTQAPPTVNTLAATPVTATTATLNGSANPNGYSTSGWFRYSTTDPSSCNDSFGTRVPTSSGVGLGSVTYQVGYSQSLSGLSPATKYYFCAIASSSIGTSFGSVLSFTTPPSGTLAPAPVALAPALRAATTPVTTLAATAITLDSAVLSGSATPGDSETQGWFRYSATDPEACSDTFGARAPAGYGVALGSGASAATFAQAITELTPGTTYYYCAIVASPAGISFGSVRSFVVGAEAPVVTTQAASDVVSTSAQLAAPVQSNGVAADPTPANSDPEETPTPAVGCAYAARTPLGGSLPPLVSLLSLASLLMIRRRRNLARAMTRDRRRAP